MTSEERERYSRHILLNEVGLSGQEKLSKAKVLVIGAGGLGCPTLQYLVAAGVGKIGIIDFDKVDVSNLQRQVLFTTEDVGINKAIAAKVRLTSLNPLIDIQSYDYELTTNNALGLFEQYDIIVDGSDNFSTRYLVNDACVIINKTLVFGSISRFTGQVTVFNYKNGPSYRCLFPTPPKPGHVPSCSEAGVLGVLPGVIGSLQANETLKLILDIGEVASGKLLMYDALSLNFSSIQFKRNDEEINSVLTRKDEFENFDYPLFCGITSVNEKHHISPENFKDYLQKGFEIIDIREAYEEPEIQTFPARRIPMQSLADDWEQLNDDKQYILCCQTGQRSDALVDLLRKKGLQNVWSLNGGILSFKIITS